MSCLLVAQGRRRAVSGTQGEVHPRGQRGRGGGPRRSGGVPPGTDSSAVGAESQHDRMDVSVSWSSCPIRSQSGTLVANGPFPHHKVKVRKEAKETKEKTAKVKKERKAGTGSPKTRKRSRQLKKEAAEDSGIENKAVENVSESVSEKPTRKPREGQDAEADGSAEDGDAPAERRSRYFSKRLKAE
eukprot:scaffold3457_cov230-Pinguiococcus_pyrenoidosus.AAC.3